MTYTAEEINELLWAAYKQLCTLVPLTDEAKARYMSRISLYPTKVISDALYKKQERAIMDIFRSNTWIMKVGK